MPDTHLPSAALGAPAVQPRRRHHPGRTQPGSLGLAVISMVSLRRRVMQPHHALRYRLVLAISGGSGRHTVDRDTPHGRATDHLLNSMHRLAYITAGRSTTITKWRNRASPGAWQTTHQLARAGSPCRAR